MAGVLSPRERRRPSAGALERFRQDYAPLMLRYLAKQDETGLQAAYELGRHAMRDSVGLLDIVRAHNELLMEVLTTVQDNRECRELTRASTTLLIDLIASFEMSQRRYMDVGAHRGLTVSEADTT